MTNATNRTPRRDRSRQTVFAPCSGGEAARKWLKKVAKDIRIAEAKVAKRKEIRGVDFSFEHTLSDLLDEVERLRKTIDRIWHDYVVVPHQDGRISDDRMSDLWDERQQVEDALQDLKRDAYGRGATTLEWLQSQLGLLADVVTAIGAVASALTSAWVGVRRVLTD